MARRGPERRPAPIGERHGRLECIGEGKAPPSGNRYITVRCDCGEVYEIQAGAWGKRSACVDCGHKARRTRVPVNLRHGKLVCIGEGSEKDKGAYHFEVRCDCGKIYEMPAKSWGTRESCLECRPPAKRRRAVPVGERYGKLECLGEAGDTFDAGGFRRQNINVRCDCGVAWVMAFSNWSSTKSCRACSFNRTIHRKPAPIGERHGMLECRGETDEVKRGNGLLLRQIIVRCNCGNEFNIGLSKWGRVNSCLECRPSAKRQAGSGRRKLRKTNMHR
jgi:hypothetical protein